MDLNSITGVFFLDVLSGLGSDRLHVFVILTSLRAVGKQMCEGVWVYFDCVTPALSTRHSSNVLQLLTSL